ncbi:MAG: sulfatase family protein [Planctomycetota bacterium]|jgi:arylsulfatase A-like enzyme
MYADDLGFGDVGCYGASAIPTPNIDRLAAGGRRFTNGYATAATCTPSRYSLLTGSYPWRNPRAAILPGDAPQIIDSGAPTLPAMLKKAGYTTGIVGKWHLGLGDGEIRWNGEIQGTPNDVGFDTSYIMAATNDRVPCVYLDNRRVENLDPNDPIEVRYTDEPFPGGPSGRSNPELLRMHPSHGHDMSIVNGVSRIGHMKGGKSALWTDETMCDVFVDKAKAFVSENQDEPFFLYYAFHQPHVPRLPAPRFVGATDLGPRGDVVVEMDWCVGQLLDHLEALGLSEETIVIFSSDNGPVLDDGYHDEAVERCGDHKQAGPLRGGKYSLFDGGTRVPFLLRWPGRVSPGESAALVCQHDFQASFAKLVGVELAADEAPDSEDVLEALIGNDTVGRGELVTEGRQGTTLFRRDDWVYIPPHDGPALLTNTNIESGLAPEAQLYNLSQDIGQITNVAGDHPERITEMASRLETIRSEEATR